MKKFMKKFMKHDRYVVKRFKEALQETQDNKASYPFLRWTIADAKCFLAVRKGLKGFQDLVRWQDNRDRYFQTIIKLRPRDNEFFSY
jgi:hypothetical protein